MRKAKGRGQLVKKLMEINDLIIMDLVVDNFNEYMLNKVFKIDSTLSLDYSQKIIYITKNIIAGNEKYLETVIRYNNTYITENGYNKLTDKEYEIEFKNEKIRSLAGEGANAEQLILYIMTTGEMKDKLEFFKRLYEEDLEQVEKYREDSLEKKPEMFELLRGTQFEMEFQTFINNGYKGIDKIGLEKLADRYRIKYNNFNNTFTVPAGFVVFFENKTLEIFNLLETFNLNFGLLHGNLKRVNGYLKEIQEVAKEAEEKRLLAEEKIKENSVLEAKNKFLEAKILAYENKEQDRLIKEQQKEINYLCGQIESLREQIKNIEQDENNTIEENIKIEGTEQLTEKEKIELKGKNITILGGKWNSKNREEVEKFFDERNSMIEFIEANRIFRSSERIANKDIIIFDTSLNSHAAYYKVKSIVENVLYINKSNVDEIKKSL